MGCAVWNDSNFLSSTNLSRIELQKLTLQLKLTHATRGIQHQQNSVEILLYKNLKFVVNYAFDWLSAL